MNKERKYYILWVNCDCAGHKEARRSLRMGIWANIRCKLCRADCGIGDYKLLGEIKAIGDLDALRKFAEKDKRKDGEMKESKEKRIKYCKCIKSAIADNYNHGKTCIICGKEIKRK